MGDLPISPYVIAVVSALIISQSLKYLIEMLRGGAFDRVRQLYASGNMPSSHSASVAALLTVVGLVDGVESGLFGLMFLFTVVVMYDTVMLRRSVGEQGKAMQLLIKLTRSDVALPHAAKGHTPLEVLVGAMLGAVIGLVVFFATK